MSNEPQPVALISGGARRIGAALCRNLHGKGYRILLHYRNSAEDAEQLAQSLNRQRADSCRTLHADLSQLPQLQQLGAAALDSWGQLDVLINNASSFYPTALNSTTEEQWDELLGSNLKAPFFLCQALAPALQQQQGVIINLVDIHGLKPLQGYPVYSIAKAGLAMLTQAMAKELAPRVRVNGVAPGPILWPEGSAAQSPTEQQQLLDKTLLGRCGSADEIAAAVICLIEQRYVTGQILAVDGGKSLYS